MLLAIDKHSALYVFASIEDAERELEAFDVQQDEFEFCDIDGRRYSPTFTRPPRQTRRGPFGIIDIGAFKLVAENGIDPALPTHFVDRAEYIEHTAIPSITSIEVLRNALQK